jgi:deoxycytidylate deaminase
MPSPTDEKHQIEVENLKWQLKYEKELHEEMNSILEDKVSNLMATITTLNK